MNKPEELPDELRQLFEERLDWFIANTPNGENDMTGVLSVAVFTVLSLEARVRELGAENDALKARLVASEAARESEWRRKAQVAPVDQR